MPPLFSATPRGVVGRVGVICTLVTFTLRSHRWFVLIGLICIGLFASILTQQTGDLLAGEPFADFYDYQAKSLLHGRWDVPPEGIAFEAFLREGKTYGYFGPTPALLRLPFAVSNVGFGRLSRGFLLAYYAGGLLAAYLLLLEASRQIADRAVPSPILVVLFIANAGIGSTLFFLGSRAYIYHEAVLCGVAFALLSLWCSFRYLAVPRIGWWAGALIFGLLSLHARPPTGLFALTVLIVNGVVVALRLRREGADALGRATAMRKGIILACLAGMGIASFSGLSYLKFRTIDGCPLRLNSQYDVDRLARIDGRQFHLSNIPFGVRAYLFTPNVTVTKYFPYVEMTAPDPVECPGARIDLAEPLLGIPFAMPGLVMAAVLSLIFMARAGTANRHLVAVLWLGVVPMGISLFAAIAVSHRYTADFCPFLIGAAALGFAGVARLPNVARILCVSALAVSTAAACLITTALTIHYQGQMVWGVAEVVRVKYCALRQNVDQTFGLRNPRGYDAASLAIRDVDARTLALTAAAFETSPAKHLQAIALYEEVTRIKPDWAIAQARLAELLLSAGRVSEGIGRYKIALQIEPAYAAAHFNLGRAYLLRRSLNEAVLEFESALRHDPTMTQARDILQELRIQQDVTRKLK